MLQVFAACANFLTLVAQEDEDLLAQNRQDTKFGILFLRRRLRLPSIYLTACFARDIPTLGCDSAAVKSRITSASSSMAIHGASSLQSNPALG